MIKVHERFNIPFGPDTVWRIVSRPEEVVSCIPGASLDERHEDDSYSGYILVPFGPIKVNFYTRVTIDLDEAARVGRVTGRGKDTAGGVRTKLALKFAVSEDGDGSTVVGDAEVTVKGPLAAVIEGGASIVAKRMLSEFSARLVDQCAESLGIPRVELHAGVEAAAAGDGWWRQLLHKLKAWIRPKRLKHLSGHDRQ